MLIGSEDKLLVERVFTVPGIHPFAQVTWETRTATIINEKGEVIFNLPEVEVPASWSLMATNVVASKYFRRGKDYRETSAKQLIARVVDTATQWGLRGDYFALPAEAEIFRDELSHLLVEQKLSFNSPVWFNLGVEAHPQCSACFINSVEDSMESILTLAKTEGMLFKGGSGTGSNLSKIRSSRELLSSGGLASGPVSFMRGWDSFAGAIKSGGKTRRAAKMVILNVNHPDILDFIQCKQKEERKAWALIDAGYDGSFNGDVYTSIHFQNANNSVRVNEEFMHAVLEDREFQTRAVTTGDVVNTYRARDLMRSIAEAAHACGDPGMQFDCTINDWHTCPNSGRINASNPCSEYMFLDDTACNLASLNLMKFRLLDGCFDIRGFRQAVRISILAQEIFVDNACYPTPKIAEMSHKFRTLGLGYANLGALLMSSGLPYDSDAGRAYAAAVTSLMCAEAYRASSEIAGHMGVFPGYAINREAMLRVIRKHRDASLKILESAPKYLSHAALKAWDEALGAGEEYGYRNAQVTVLAPTGTIGFMMDCDTTGVEPDIALVKYKKLVGGGMLKLVNQTVPMALRTLQYRDSQIEDIVKFIDQNETIEGAPHLKPEHLPVFDCAFQASHGTRFIHYLGHLWMMGAVQPFLSGAISKTVNLPSTAKVEEIEQAFLEGWRLGLKALAVYRDGCKRSQPLNTSAKADGSDVVAKEVVKEVIVHKPVRRRLPTERNAVVHKFEIDGHEGYLTASTYEDGSPGEIFIKIAKQGSMVSGMADTVATLTSLALQYGVPLHVLVQKFSHMRFEPAGWTKNPQIRHAKSIVDYVFRWLAQKFLPVEEGLEEYAPASDSGLEEPSLGTEGDPTSLRQAGKEKQPFKAQTDAPPCPKCGELTVRSGACYRCHNCGESLGCS